MTHVHAGLHEGRGCMHADTKVVAVVFLWMYSQAPAQFYTLLVTPVLQPSTFSPFPSLPSYLTHTQVKGKHALHVLMANNCTPPRLAEGQVSKIMRVK